MVRRSGPVQTGGLDQAIGELVTCSRCVGTWAAAGLGVTQVLAPRFGRLLTLTLAAGAINDFLQAGLRRAHRQGERARAQGLNRARYGRRRRARLTL